MASNVRIQELNDSRKNSSGFDWLTLGRLGVKHLRNHMAEAVYLKAGRDFTKPIAFYASVNERCNVKCRFCAFWRLESYMKEMSIAEWQSALTSVRQFVGEFSISFSGGEPYLKPGFLDLLAWCRDNDIRAGVTTNGSALNRRNAAKTVATRPFNVNVSVDAPTAAVHDYLRGAPGLFDRAASGIGHLREAQERTGISFPIVVKSTVNRENFRHMPAMVEWAKSVGATAVNLQPMDHWTPETYDELWLEPDELPALQIVVDELIAQKRRGEPILNAELTLSLMPSHFRGEKAPASAMPCRVGLRDFFIRPNGDVAVCFFYPPIGNIREKSAEALWRSAQGREIRAQTIACDKLCLHTCLSHKTLADKARMAVSLMRNRAGTARAF